MNQEDEQSRNLAWGASFILDYYCIDNKSSWSLPNKTQKVKES